MLITRTAFALDAANVNPVAPWDRSVLCAAVSSLFYAVALFRYHMFDLMPTARQTAIEQMREGMVVLDAGQRIADLNPPAARIPGVSVAHARGRGAAEALSAELSPAGLLQGSTGAQSEITLGRSEAARHYALHVSPLQDHPGAALGILLLLHDVTEERRTQATSQ
jgi:PAS domain S-box-containing protein